MAKAQTDEHKALERMQAKKADAAGGWRKSGKYSDLQIDAALRDAGDATPDLFDADTGVRVKFPDTVNDPPESPIAYRWVGRILPNGDAEEFVYGVPCRDLTRNDVERLQLKAAVRVRDLEENDERRAKLGARQLADPTTIVDLRDVTEEVLDASPLFERVGGKAAKTEKAKEGADK